MKVRISAPIFLIFLACYTWAEDIKPWSIAVHAYSNEREEIPQLDAFAIFAARETGKGFLNRTIIKREYFHFGATFCILMDYRIYEPARERQRILADLEKIGKGSADDVYVEVTNPSDCFVE